MSRSRRGRRNVHGLLLLDKPSGLTSNAALQRVKRNFNAAKAGHTGSLDPMATGVLPICLGNATRLAGYLLESDKCYRATVKLGEQTDTGDLEGAVIARSDPQQLGDGAIEAAAAKFHGAQKQVPPMYSALKRQGRPLYELARRGEVVAREARDIVVHDLRVVDRRGDRFVFDVRCSKGTYVRTLAEDWAASVGQCAHLVALRRTRLGRFGADALVTLDALQQMQDMTARDALLNPMAGLLDGWPQVVVDDTQAHRLRHGQQVQCHVAGCEAGRLAVFDEKGEVLCIGEIDGAGVIAPRRWLAPQA